MTCARIRGGNPLASGLKIVRKTTLLALALLSAAWLEPLRHQASSQTACGVAIVQVDTDRRFGHDRSEKIDGQFLEHINHSVEDGLFADQIRGAGFEGRDFETYWTPFGPPDAVRVVDTSRLSVEAACPKPEFGSQQVAKMTTSGHT
jgi:hypothetical protein